MKKPEFLSMKPRGDCLPCPSDGANLGGKTMKRPVFNTDNDLKQGLQICVNGLWGNEIIVKSYTCDGLNYSGTLTFTLYDHFGLDTDDINAHGAKPGFVSWYILQHYTDYKGKYRPFLTLMSFDVPFSGKIV